MMTARTGTLRITDVRIVTPDNVIEAGTLCVQDSAISEVRSRVVTGGSDETRLSVPNLTLLPGFIDLHIHGGGGADTMDGTAESLRTICRTHARYGTTGLFFTTMTQSRDRITRALGAARQAVRQGAMFCMDGAQPLGIHLEGPYISPVRPGAQPKGFVRLFDSAEWDEWRLAADETLRLITLAPEMTGANRLMNACREAGIVVSMGHTDASAQETADAIEQGVTQATHLFNAMPSIHHRKPGPIPVLLADERVTTEIIADGCHLAPEIVRMTLKAKGIGGVILITDAMAGAGSVDGQYELGGSEVTVADGRAALKDGTLAGSVLTMSTAARNVRDWCGLDWVEIARITSANAAEQFDYTFASKGAIVAGHDADFVLVDDDFTVHYTFVAGRCVYRRE